MRILLIEDEKKLCDLIERSIRETIPADQLDTIVANIGMPISGINIAYNNTGTIGPEDADVLISLKADHSPTASYVTTLRTALPQKFPGTIGALTVTADGQRVVATGDRVGTMGINPRKTMAGRLQR